MIDNLQKRREGTLRQEDYTSTKNHTEMRTGRRRGNCLVVAAGLEGHSSLENLVHGYREQNMEREMRSVPGSDQDSASEGPYFQSPPLDTFYVCQTGDVQSAVVSSLPQGEQ